MARILSFESLLELGMSAKGYYMGMRSGLSFMEATGSSATIKGGGGGSFKMNQRKQRAVSRRRKMKPSAR